MLNGCHGNKLRLNCKWITPKCALEYLIVVMEALIWNHAIFWLLKLKTCLKSHFPRSHSLLSWQLPRFHGNEYPKISSKRIIVPLLTWVPSIINITCAVCKLYLFMLIGFTQFEHFWCHSDCYVPIQILVTRLPNFCMKSVYLNTCNLWLGRFITKRKTVFDSW